VLEGSYAQNKVTCDHSRFLEYTDKELIDRFDTVQDKEFLEYPAIFMGEGFDGETARIGKLIKVSKIGGVVKAQYAIDPELPPLTNGQLFELGDELEIADFEFSRNHWALKDVDLFEVLYRAGIVSSNQPKVFALSDSPVDRSLISVMMPFDRASDDVYRSIKDAVENEGLRCQRADDIWKHAHIMQDVIELICTASVVICDLSGKNPNVFYETGIAHSLGKEVILITQTMDDVPFDLRSLRCITYLNNGEGRVALTDRLVARIKDLV